MATGNPTSGGTPGNPTIIELAPDVVTIAADFATGGVQVEVFDSNANTACRTLLDVGDALNAALRLVGAVVRPQRLMAP